MLSLLKVLSLSLVLSYVSHVSCAAIPISDGQTLSGSTVGQPTLTPIGNTFCGTAITGPGILYVIEGNGGTLTASTCNQASFDTRLLIYTGPDENTLTCVSGRDDSSGCGGFTTELTVNTDENTLYFILVTGFGTASGTFDLTATLGVPPLTGIFPISDGATATGTTVGAPILQPNGITFCGTSISASGVMYVIEGNGRELTASTCNQATFDTKLFIFTGPDVDSVSCVSGNDDFCGLQSEVTVDTTNGALYFIVVSGFGSASGEYSLTVTLEDSQAPTEEPTQQPENNDP